MTPKFSKADAYRTDKIIVSLCDKYEGQHIIKDMEKIGEYEGANLNTTLMFVYRQEKDRQFQQAQKKLQKSYEIER